MCRLNGTLSIQSQQEAMKQAEESMTATRKNAPTKVIQIETENVTRNGFDVSVSCHKCNKRLMRRHFDKKIDGFSETEKAKIHDTIIKDMQKGEYFYCCKCGTKLN